MRGSRRNQRSRASEYASAGGRRSAAPDSTRHAKRHDLKSEIEALEEESAEVGVVAVRQPEFDSASEREFESVGKPEFDWEDPEGYSAPV